jgi:hypothetical protein
MSAPGTSTKKEITMVSHASRIPAVLRNLHIEPNAIEVHFIKEYTKLNHLRKLNTYVNN